MPVVRDVCLRRKDLLVAVAAVCAVLIVLAPRVQAQASAEEVAAKCKLDASEPKGLPFGADGRMKLLSTGPLKAGEPNEISIALTGPPVNCIFIDAVELAELHHRANGTSYVVVTPTEMGKVPLVLMAFFSDGGFGTLQTEMEVVPSDRTPTALILQGSGEPGSDTALVRLSLKDSRWNQDPAYWEHVYAAAFYPDSKKPVEIAPEFLKFAFKQSREKPVLEIAKDGGFKPLRTGDALLSVTFGNTTRETCIQVRDDVFWGDNTRCDQLRSPRAEAPLDTVWTVNPDGLGSSISHSDFFVSRIAVKPPDHPVALAQPVRIPLTITGGTIRRITYEQKRAGSNATLSFDPLIPGPKRPVMNSDTEDGRFLDGPDGTKIFELIPVELGDETVRITARFEDGGFDERFFHLRTEPTDQNLDRIDIDYRIYPLGHPHIDVGLKYKHLQNPIMLHTLDRVKFAVTPTDVVRCDSDGTAHELKNGTAMVSARLGSVQSTRSIRVDLAESNPKPLDRVTGEAALADDGDGSPQIGIIGISDTHGVDFRTYLGRSKRVLKAKWMELFGRTFSGSQQPPGDVAIRFKLLPNGYIVNGSMILDRSSGHTSLDRAAWVTISNTRFGPLPGGFQGTVQLRVEFRTY